MRKFLLAAICVVAVSAATSVLSGCGPEVRTMPAPTTTTRPNFRSAIQNNPNIPADKKAAFK